MECGYSSRRMTQRNTPPQASLLEPGRGSCPVSCGNRIRKRKRHGSPNQPSRTATRTTSRPAFHSRRTLSFPLRAWCRRRSRSCLANGSCALNLSDVALSCMTARLPPDRRCATEGRDRTRTTGTPYPSRLQADLTLNRSQQLGSICCKLPSAWRC